MITDFGLARGLDAGAALASISEAGAVVGTAAYMAPEQVEGLAVTPAADIYALGIVVYEMLTGPRPVRRRLGPTSIAVRRLTEAPPAPRVHLPDIDSRWEDAILRCLRREPSERFSTTLELAEALRGGAPASKDSVARKQIDATSTTFSPGPPLRAGGASRLELRPPRRRSPPSSLPAATSSGREAARSPPPPLLRPRLRNPRSGPCAVPSPFSA